MVTWETPKCSCTLGRISRSKSHLVHAGAVGAGFLRDGAVAVPVVAVRGALVAAVAAVVVVVAPPPAGHAAAVAAPEVRGVAGARALQFCALALRLVGAVVAVGIAVAPPVLRDAAAALREGGRFGYYPLIHYIEL